MAPRQYAAPKGKLKLMIAVAGVFVILGGGAATWFLFFRSGHDAAKPSTPKRRRRNRLSSWMCRRCWSTWSGRPASACNISRSRSCSRSRKSKQVEAIKPTLPRVTDLFQTYLRELRPIDLNGSAGLFRLKEELTRRVNVAVAPNAVDRRAVQGNRRSVTRRI